MDFTGKKVMVVGMAKSGVASAKLLIEKGANIALYDAKDIGQFEPHAFDMFSGQAEFAFGADPNAVAQNSDILVLSPGVPTKLAFIEDAFKNGKKSHRRDRARFFVLRSGILSLSQEQTARRRRPR